MASFGSIFLLYPESQLGPDRFNTNTAIPEPAKPSSPNVEEARTNTVIQGVFFTPVYRHSPQNRPIVLVHYGKYFHINQYI